MLIGLRTVDPTENLPIASHSFLPYRVAIGLMARGKYSLLYVCKDISYILYIYVYICVDIYSICVYIYIYMYHSII